MIPLRIPPEELPRLFRFTEADLLANQQGQISASQGVSLPPVQARTWSQDEITDLAFNSAFWVFVAVLGALLTLNASDGLSFSIAGSVGLAVCLGLLWWIPKRKPKQPAESVQKVCGILHVKKESSYVEGDLYSLVCGGQRFPLSKREYEELLVYAVGNLPPRYCLYFAQLSHRLLSVEMREQTAPSKPDLPPKIGEIFRFTGEDLHANHAGHFSARQLATRPRRWQRGYWHSSEQIARVVGTVRVEQVNSATYYLFCRLEWFTISRKQYEDMQHYLASQQKGQEYVLYFTANTRRILSLTGISMEADFYFEQPTA